MNKTCYYIFVNLFGKINASPSKFMQDTTMAKAVNYTIPFQWTPCFASQWCTFQSLVGRCKRTPSRIPKRHAKEKCGNATAEDVNNKTPTEQFKTSEFWVTKIYSFQRKRNNFLLINFAFLLIRFPIWQTRHISGMSQQRKLWESFIYI